MSIDMSPSTVTEGSVEKEGVRLAGEPDPAVALFDARRREETVARATADGLLVVGFEAPGPSGRGRLGLLVESAIESALESLGAPPPGVGASSDLDASLSDQLYRARLVGSDGIILVLPRLEGISNLAGALDAEDSAVLRWWLVATRERPVRLFVDPADRYLGVYGPPLALVDLMEGARDAMEDAAPTASSSQTASVDAMREAADAHPASRDDDAIPEATTSETTDGAPGEEPGEADASDATAEQEDAPPPDDVEAAASDRATEEEHAQPANDTDAADDALATEEEQTQSANDIESSADEPATEQEHARHWDERADDDAVADRDEETVDDSVEAAARDAVEASGADDGASIAPPDGDLEAGAIADPIPPDLDEPPANDAEDGRGDAPADGLDDDVEADDATGTDEDTDDDFSEFAADFPADDDESPADARAEITLDDSPPAPAVHDLWLEALDDHAEGFDMALESIRSMTTVIETEPPPRSDEERIDLQAVLEAHDQPADDEPVVIRPLHPRAPKEWPTWMRQLESARGPKPLAVIERLFVSAYVPLRDAVACGIAGEEARPVLDTWAKSFEKSYSEAFDALRLRGKRPTMVLDAPEIAARIGRLHGARTAQLLLVDGMRFDVGLRMHEHLRERVADRAACAERLLIWSALPATTETQLELLGRGPEGLKEIPAPADVEEPVARGRAASIPRRVKTHHREVLKLDVAEAKLSVPGGPEIVRVDRVGRDVADALATHFESVPPRTLVLVFGDHGFVLDARDGGTTRARQGGALPEEVLVPAFAWLVGDVH